MKPEIELFADLRPAWIAPVDGAKQMLSTDTDI
jgi:hypothetical protein